MKRTLVAALVAAWLLAACSSSKPSRSASSNTPRPRLTTAAGACAIEADAGSDFLVANNGSDGATVQLLGGLSLTSNDSMTQIMISGVGAYNHAVAPPTSASPSDAEQALMRNNAALCKSLDDPILSRSQVSALEQLAGSDDVLLADIAVFNDESGNSPGGQSSAPPPSASAPPTVQSGSTADAGSTCSTSALKDISIPSGGRYVITDIYLAPSDHAWARFNIAPATPGTADTIKGYAHCLGGKWKPVDWGSFAVGCTSVPQSLWKELDVIECS